MLHPSVRDGLEDQYPVIEAARRERKTRLASSESHLSRSQSTASTSQSRQNAPFYLPSASSSPLQRTPSPRTAISTHSQPDLKRGESSSSRNKASFLSGEIRSEHAQDSYFCDVLPCSMRRTSSQTSDPSANARSSALRNRTTSSPSGQSAFMSGSIERTHATNVRSYTGSRSPLSSPQAQTVPSRFTRSTSASAGPGSMYGPKEHNPFFTSPVRRKANSTETSPRSSLSSKSNKSSLRWSSGSNKTASTSQSTAHYTPMTDIIEIKRDPLSDPCAKEAPVNDSTSKVANFSWLSFGDKEDDVQRTSDMEAAPPMERKNSLWRESLDSIASTHLDLLEDKEDIRATHFPVPPPMSRSNSMATTILPDLEEQGVLRPDGHQLDRGPPEFEPAREGYPSSTSHASSDRKASIAEMLRVHVVSPLSRQRSQSSSIHTTGSRERPGYPRTTSSSSSSGSVLGASSLSAQALCFA